MGMHFPAAYPSNMPPCHARRAIARRIERLIAVLDAMDVDPDLEEDDPWEDSDVPEDDDPKEEDDHAGGNVTDDPHDQHENLMPIYAIDQSCGPINEVQAKRDYERRMYGR